MLSRLGKNVCDNHDCHVQSSWSWRSLRRMVTMMSTKLLWSLCGKVGRKPRWQGPSAGVGTVHWSRTSNRCTPNTSTTATQLLSCTRNPFRACRFQSVHEPFTTGGGRVFAVRRVGTHWHMHPSVYQAYLSHVCQILLVHALLARRVWYLRVTNMMRGNCTGHRTNVVGSIRGVLTVHNAQHSGGATLAAMV
jgi:hypothetical protein